LVLIPNWRIKDAIQGKSPNNDLSLTGAKNLCRYTKTIKVGSTRTARRLTFVQAATKVSKNAFAPCGGHLLCRVSETSK